MIIHDTLIVECELNLVIVSKRMSDIYLPQKSLISSRVDRLKGATLKIIRGRDRLPQPFFWSLFHSEIAEIKKKKHKQRVYDNTILGLNRP